MTDKPKSIAHRPLLDGTRGVMMCVVLGYHLDGITKLPGAWVSMDFFFVLSGYLITTLLIREREHYGRLDMVSFFRRRVRRLGPALLTVVAAVFIAAWLLGGVDEFPDMRGDGLATMFYVANWHFIWSAQSYFASFGLSPLRHAWSLAIEEQFYLLWPFLFLLLVRLTNFNRKVMMGVLGAVAVVSALWMRHLALGDVDLSRAYYGTDTRGQGLMVGALMALLLWHERWDGPKSRKVGSIIGTAALAGLVAMMFLFSDSSRAVYTNGGFLLISVVSALFIFGCARADSGPLAWIFGNRVSRHMGAVSYCFYLWHWPVIIFLDKRRLDWTSWKLDLLRVVISLALAEITYWFLERPIHTQRWKMKKQGLIMGGAFLAVLGLLFVTTTGTSATRPPASGGGEQNSGADSTASAGEVLVVGDSLAWLISGQAPEDYPYKVDGVFQAHCDVIGNTIYSGDRTEHADKECPKWSLRWAAGVEEHKPDAVLVALGLRQLFDPEVDGARLVVGTAEWRTAYDAAIRRAADIIRDRTDAPIFWLDVPCFTWAEVGGGEEHDAKRLDIVNAELRKVLATYPDITVVDYRQRVCTGDDLTKVDTDIRPDGAHLSPDAAKDLWRDLEPEIKKAIAAN